MSAPASGEAESRCGYSAAMNWVTVYDIRTNPPYVHLVQQATLNRPGYGLDPEPGLFGSEEWWRAVEAGRLPSAEAEGVVADVRWESMGDWPGWTFRALDGTESRWTREGDHTRYVVGLGARIQTVEVKWKADSHVVRQQGERPEHWVLVKVQLEHSELRSEALGPGPFPGA
jgi:hypothetical protein